MNQFRRTSESSEPPAEDQEKSPDISDDDLRWAGVTANDTTQAFEDTVTDYVVDEDAVAKQNMNVDAVSADQDKVGSASGDQWSDGVAVPFRSEGAELRASGAQRALDDAMVDWLKTDELPSPSVLRDGLLLLNAGYDVDEGQRALLLRAALHYRRGVVTALLHQADLERSALILHDAIVDPQHPLPLAQLARLIEDSPTVDGWEPYLHAELLVTARSFDSARSRLADAALLLLDTGETVEPLENPANSSLEDSRVLDEIVDELENSRSPLLLTMVVAVLVMVVLLLMVVAVFQYDLSRTKGMIELPGGEYSLALANGSTHIFEIGDILLDESEVTNGQYRRCERRGKCPAPLSNDSASRQSYYDDGAFDDFPVIHVNHDSAEAYCDWAGKRLPTASEWQVAASLAPATGRSYLFPWGDRYVSGVANDANAVHGDTLATGAYRPGGDSPLGLVDMAGNVAEWTSSRGLTDGAAYQVKGGSFQDGAKELQTNHAIEVEPNVATESIGFRCATRSLESMLRSQIE